MKLVKEVRMFVVTELNVDQAEAIRRARSNKILPILLADDEKMYAEAIKKECFNTPLSVMPSEVQVRIKCKLAKC